MNYLICVEKTGVKKAQANTLDGAVEAATKLALDGRDYMILDTTAVLMRDWRTVKVVKGDAKAKAKLALSKAQLREQNRRLVEALSSIVTVMNDSTAAGTNVDGQWMGIPDWDQVNAATQLLKEIS